jgi:UDP-glucose 4-epimerase
MTWIITGASGFLGSRVAAEFFHAERDFIGLDLNLERVKSQLWESKIRCLDLRDYSLLETFFKSFNGNIEGIVHLAALKNASESNKYSDSYWKSNFEATANLFNLSKRIGVKKFIFASSAAVYGPQENELLSENQLCLPNSTYGATKLASEKFLEGSESHGAPECISLRIFNMIGGNRNDLKIDGGGNFPFRVFDSILNKTPLHVYTNNKKSGSGIRDYINVNDVVGAIMQISDSDSICGSYNLCTGRGVSSLELVSMVENFLGSRVAFTHSVSPFREADVCIGDPFRFRQDFNFFASNSVENSISQMMREFGL